jgi:hypothetical protein
MGVTRYPDGIDLGNEAGTQSELLQGGTTINLVVNPLAYASADKKCVAGTVVVPTGAAGTAFTVTGLSTINYVMATPYSTVEGVAGFAGVHASQSGGTVTLIGISGAGTASTASGTATYLAVGAA